MAKVQRCLMCGESMYELDTLGAAAGGHWPEQRTDPQWGIVLICPHCDAEHVTIADQIPGLSPVLRVRGLKPR